MSTGKPEKKEKKKETNKTGQTPLRTSCQWHAKLHRLLDLPLLPWSTEQPNRFRKNVARASF